MSQKSPISVAVVRSFCSDSNPEPLQQPEDAPGVALANTELLCCFFNIVTLLTPVYRSVTGLRPP